jgi:hypothetical protein
MTDYSGESWEDTIAYAMGVLGWLVVALVLVGVGGVLVWVLW